MIHAIHATALAVVLGSVPFASGDGASDAPGAGLAPWGSRGHELAARAAVETLPDDVPSFFRDAGAQLEWLDAEPDRWRSRAYPAMDGAFSYDHYVDLENVPAGALEAPDRWAFLARLHRETELDRPERDAGFLPYRILELYQRVLTGFRRWREAGDAEERRWIEARIVNDAGILGHYVTDASQPQHTTIHFNGWAEGAANPEGFTTSRDFHRRFEAEFVRAHVRWLDVGDRIGQAPRILDDVRRGVLDFILESHAEVERLYRLERDAGFDPEGPADLAAKEFAVLRLVAGARMLRDLWWTAWIRSGEPSPEGQP